MTANRLYLETLVPLAAPLLRDAAAFARSDLPQGNALLTLERSPHPYGGSARAAARLGWRLDGIEVR